MDKASIIIADENILLRKFLRRNMQWDQNLWVINEADDGLELLEQLKESTPDLIILQKSLPTLSGLDAAKIIKEQFPLVKIVILTRELNHKCYCRASEIGVDGYVLTNEIGNITNIINIVIAGKTYISPYFHRQAEV